MRILKIIGRFLICILCCCFLYNTSYAANNIPFGDITEYGDWINPDNMNKFRSSISTDMSNFQTEFQNNVQAPNFIPLEVKIGLAFMRALSSIDYVLQISLVRFTIIFLFVMYAFWIAIEAYKMMRESSDYKTVFYDVFKKGMIIAIWVIVLQFGVVKLFTLLINPILAFGAYFSNFILDSVAQSYDVKIPDTCMAIQQYVYNNSVSAVANGAKAQLMIPPETAANIMCLPARVSTYFYQATAVAWKWMINGFSQSTTQIFVGGICIVMFIKCIFKYAFMTLGVVAELFLRLLMLPFTALAESLPSTDEKGYIGQIFNGFLKIFNTQKLSDVIAVFVNATIYFISLAIVIAICAALLTNIIDLNNDVYTTGRAMKTILCGALVLHLANKADELAKKIGGSVDNSFGTKLASETKTLWDDTKNIAGKIYKDWVKK